MKFSFLLLVFLCAATLTFAQAPQMFTYQAIARDYTGEPVTNQRIGVRLSIIKNSVGGEMVYSEIHYQTSNNFGLVNIKVGDGIFEYGDFSEIDWWAAPHYVKVEMDLTGESNFELVGTTQLLSVPYALYANHAGNISDADSTNELQNLTLNGNELGISGGNTVTLNPDDADADPQNELITNAVLAGNILQITDAGGVQNIDLSPLADNQTLAYDAANYILSIAEGNTVDLSNLLNDPDHDPDNELIASALLQGNLLKITDAGATHTIDLSVFADDQNLSFDAENAILSLEEGGTVDLGKLINDADADPTNEIQTLSVLDNQISISDGNTIEILRKLLEDVDKDTRVEVEYISDEDQIRFFAGGNEIFRLNQSGRIEILGENVFIGENTGEANSSGNQNTFLGYQSGIANSSGSQNLFLASQSGYSNQTGSSNVFAGNNAGYSNTGGNHNAFFGWQSGYSNTSASENAFFGSTSGYANATGNRNLFAGFAAGYSNLSGSHNTAVGYQAAFGAETGSENVALGTQAAFSNLSGKYNTLIGFQSAYNLLADGNLMAGYKSGFSSTWAQNNVFLGREAAYHNQTGSKNLIAGAFAGYSSLAGENNVFLGYQSAYTNTGDFNAVLGGESLLNNSSGSRNVMLGYQSGFNNFSGSGNIFIGYRAGYNQTASDKLVIENSASETPLIYGEFDNDLLVFNSKVSISTATPPAETLEVGGAIKISTTSLSNAGTIRWNGTNFQGYDGSQWKDLDKQFPIDLQDQDADTRIAVEETTDDDIIRLFAQANEWWRFLPTGQFEFLTENIAIGENSGENQTSAVGNVWVGRQSGKNVSTGSYNVFLGTESGLSATAGSENAFFGYQSGLTTSDGNQNTFVGTASGYSNQSGSANVFLGYKAGYNETASHRLYIANSATDNPLIYGEFDTQNLIFNANLGIKTPAAPLEALEVNGGIKIGNTTYTNEGTLRWNGSNFEGFDGTSWRILDMQYRSEIRDADNDTRLSLEENADDDTLRLFVGGTERLKIGGKALELPGTNVFVGEKSGQIAAGENNVFVGAAAGRNNASGSGNVFIGNNAGENETGSNRLYIANSATTEPLIYGEFDNNELKVNGKTHINNVLRLVPRATPPDSPQTGDMYLGTDDKLYIYLSTGEWKALAFQ